MEQNLDQLSEELINHALAVEVAKRIAAEQEKQRKYGNCPHCKYGSPRDSKTTGIKYCNSCRAYFGENYSFEFPLWAQDRKAHFRRFICLIFNIQFKRTA